MPKGFSGGSDGEESACNEGDLGLIPGSGRFPGEGNGNPLLYSCLEISMDRGAWWATVHRVTESLNTHTKVEGKGNSVLTNVMERNRTMSSKNRGILKVFFMFTKFMIKIFKRTILLL